MEYVRSVIWLVVGYLVGKIAINLSFFYLDEGLEVVVSTLIILVISTAYYHFIVKKEFPGC